MNVAFKPQTPLLDLDLLKTLVAIAETGNFSAAADVVFRTPSAISMQIKRMEELLGRPVFIRDSRSVTLTEDGDALLVHARRVLALNQQIIAQFITPDVEGTVRLGATDHATEKFLPAALRRFAETHPAVTVDVTVEDSEVMQKMVDRAELDIALVSRCANKNENNKAEILCYEKLVWAGLKGGIAAEKTPLPISIWEEGCVWRHAALSGLKKIGREYHVTFKASHISAQKAGILADLAIAPLPISSCTGQVIALDSSFGLPPLPDFAVGMLLSKNANAPVNAVADHLRALFADQSA